MNNLSFPLNLTLDEVCDRKLALFLHQAHQIHWTETIFYTTYIQPLVITQVFASYSHKLVVLSIQGIATLD